MKKTITPEKVPSSWDADALYNKAMRYAENMSALPSDDWQHALWSSLSLELLARAALANISPALLADTDRSWASLYHALGFKPIEEKFAPKSIAVSEVFRRLSAILPTLAKEHENFGIFHTGRRNSELHSGELAFDGIKGSTWQPMFYQTCEILLTSMGLTLEKFVGKKEADVARKLIAAAADNSAKAVQGEISAHQKVWNGKEQKEREKLAAQAAVWATRQAGHRVDCPACKSQALVVGEPVSIPVQKLKDEEIIETQEYLPNHFQCIACGLKISALSRLNAAGLGDRYRKTSVYNAADYYAPPDDLEDFDDDNNEW